MYTVENIAAMLNVNKETVRRWIRSGKLEGTILSKKGGYVVSEEQLNKFLSQYKKKPVKTAKPDDRAGRQAFDEFALKMAVLNYIIGNADAIAARITELYTKRHESSNEAEAV